MSNDSILEQFIEGTDRTALTRAADAVSARYRDRSGSLAIQNEVEALAYAAVRMPATAAAIDHVLAQDTGAVPASVLDFGAGPGTAALAAQALWPDANITLIETNAAMRGIAQKILPGARFASTPVKVDVVMAAYVLNELSDPAGAAKTLWAATGDRLILIDTGTPAGSRMMLDVRDALIALGAHIHAPCPHMMTCPFASGAEGWCHFSVRLERSRLHKYLKGATLGYEDEKFTYLIAGRNPAPAFDARIIGYPRIGKVIGLPLCKREGVLETAQIAKRDPRYKAAKKSRWGDTF